MSSYEESLRRVEAFLQARVNFEARAEKLILMRMNATGISTINTTLMRGYYTLDARISMLWSEVPKIDAILDRCIVETAAQMILDQPDERQPFPFIPRRIAKPWLNNANHQPLDETFVDVWIADLAVEARQRRDEKLNREEPLWC
jgi:hypothetical protein